MKLEEEIKQGTPFSSEFERLVVNLMFTGGWLAGHQHRFFKEFGLSVQQYNILRILRGQQGKPIGIQGITERMLDKMSNTSRLIDKLKDKGYVERKECPTDRRQVEITILPKGMEVLGSIDLRRNYIDEIAGNLTADEAATINQLLDKLRG